MAKTVHGSNIQFYTVTLHLNNVCLLQILLAFEFEILSVKVFINTISFILFVAV